MKIDWKKIVVTISIIFVTAIVVGGSTWLSFADAVNKNNEHINSLEDQISDLSGQVIKKKEEKKAKEKAEAEARAKAEAEAAAAAKTAEEAAKKSVAKTTTTPKTTTQQPTPAPSSQIYYFYSPYCGTCTAQTPIVNELAAEGIPFVFMNVVANPSYISQYGISTVPTFILNGVKQSAFFTKSQLLNFWNTYK